MFSLLCDDTLGGKTSKYVEYTRLDYYILQLRTRTMYSWNFIECILIKRFKIISIFIFIFIYLFISQILA